jgi:hypothetical protein
MSIGRSRLEISNLGSNSFKASSRVWLTFAHDGHEMSECEGVPKLRWVADRLETAHLRVQARSKHGPQWRSRPIGNTI